MRVQAPQRASGPISNSKGTPQLWQHGSPRKVMLRQHGAQSVPAAPTLVPQARQRGGSSKSSAVPASRRKTAGRARLSMPAMTAMTARRRCRCQRRSWLAVLSRRHTGLFYVILLLGETIVAASDFEERAAGGGIFHL